MLTVEVEFPTGKREVVGYAEHMDVFRRPRPQSDEILLIKPAPLRGWEFHQTIHGDWYAFAVPVDRDNWSRSG